MLALMPALRTTLVALICSNPHFCLLRRLIVSDQTQNGAHLLAASNLQNLREYSHEQETAGFEVLSISFDHDCRSTACWEITIKYNLVKDTISV